MHVLIMDWAFSNGNGLLIFEDDQVFSWKLPVSKIYPCGRRR
jgi:hypothetical protein